MAAMVVMAGVQAVTVAVPDVTEAVVGAVEAAMAASRMDAMDHHVSELAMVAPLATAVATVHALVVLDNMPVGAATTLRFGMANSPIILRAIPWLFHRLQRLAQVQLRNHPKQSR